MSYEPIQGKEPELKRLSIKELYIPVKYQRNLDGASSLRNIEHIEKNFNWDMFGILTVCKTTAKFDKYSVLDGQHRLRAAERRDDISVVPCLILAPRDYKAQAAIFLDINSRRVPLNSFQTHRAALIAGDPLAEQLEAICKEAGVVVPSYIQLAANAKPDHLFGIGRLRGMLARKVLEPISIVWSLKIIRAAFPTTKGALGLNLILALIKWIETYPQTKRDDIVKTLNTMDLRDIEWEARKLRSNGSESLWKAQFSILEKQFDNVIGELPEMSPKAQLERNAKKKKKAA